MTRPELEEAIVLAKSIEELESLIEDLRALSEEEKAKLRIPYHAATELILRIAAAPATSRYPSSFKKD